MKSEIKIEIEVDEMKMPSKIEWSATDSDIAGTKESNAMMVAFWDSEEKQTLGIDLWTEKMLVDEMDIFVYQTLVKMSDTYKRATRNETASKMIENFANEFAAAVNKKARKE